MNKAAKIIIALVIVAGVLLLFLSNKHSNSPDNLLKIGSILPVTGDYASIAEEVNRGALIAIEEAKARGEQIEYISEDDQFKATGSVNAANKLINQNDIDAAFTMAIEEVKPVAPMFNSSKKPILAVWDSNDYIKTAGNYIFSTGFATEANGQAMADYAFNKLGVKKVATIEQIDVWSELIAKAFNQKFQSLGGTVVMDEKTLTDEQDFKTLISKAKIAGAEAIYFPVNPPGGSRIITQARQLQFSGPLLSADGLIQAEINAAGKAAENTYLTDIYADKATDLLKKYKTKYGMDSAAPAFTAFGYDAVNTLIEGHKISLAKNIGLREALMQVNIQGATDKIDMNGKQYSEKLERIFKIVNGKPELVKVK